MQIGYDHVCPVSFRKRPSIRIVPACPDPRIHAALYITCQRVSDNEHLRQILRLNLLEHLHEETGIRLPDTQLFRQEYAVHQFSYTRSAEFLRLGSDRPVGYDILSDLAFQCPEDTEAVITNDDGVTESQLI